MIWESDGLFQKASVYFQRAYAGNRDDDQFPLNVSLGFELLARAALAGVHPALLADPTQGDNILYAFGFPAAGQPKSIPVKTVLSRLTVVIDGFTDADFKLGTSVTQMRNAELHSADLPFETFRSGLWMPQLLQTSSVLCASVGKTLEDLLGVEDAATAAEMIEALQEGLKKEALQAVADAKKAFEQLGVEERLELVKQAKSDALRAQGWADQIVTCPACGADALLVGKAGRVIESTASADGVEEKTVVMPAALRCTACGLSLAKHGHLYHLGMGNEFTVAEVIEPVEYFGIDLDPADYFEPEYGND